jgi:uncharacterized membrane protein
MMTFILFISGMILLITAIHIILNKEDSDLLFISVFMGIFAIVLLIGAATSAKFSPEEEAFKICRQSVSCDPIKLLNEIQTYRGKK